MFEAGAHFFPGAVGSFCKPVDFDGISRALSPEPKSLRTLIPIEFDGIKGSP
jgi:hypothetical protein